MAEGALRLLLLREHGLSSSSSPSISGVGVEEEQKSATKLLDNGEPAAAAAAAVEAESGIARKNATNRLCILLALAELRSEDKEEEKTAVRAVAALRVAADRGPSGGDGGVSNHVGDETDGTTTADRTAKEETSRQEEEGVEEATEGPVLLARLARGAAEDFGVGAVERGVGYALAATDGRAVLGALRDLLEQAEGRVKALRDAAAEQGGDSVAGGKPAGGDHDEVIDEGDD